MRPRVLVSTDIGGTDPDDFQSMVHLLLYADVLDLEGLISSPYGDGRVADIHSVIDAYEHDLPSLRRHSEQYPSAARLRSIVRQGALTSAPPAGHDRPTEGSDWIIRCANAVDHRRLDVLIWGGIDDLAQALHDDPQIAERIRVHYIGGPNKMWSVDSYHYLQAEHPDLMMIESNSTYRGFFAENDSDGPDNERFVAEHVAGHGALGELFADHLPSLKMGDSPTVGWLLHGPRDPAEPSWGGRFIPVWPGRTSTIHGLPSAAVQVETYSVVELILPVPVGYGPADVSRLIIDGRVGGPSPVGVPVGDGLRFRFSPRDPKVISIDVESSHPDLNGSTGAVTACGPADERWHRPDRRHPNWWSDDQDPAVAIDGWPGAASISRWRDDYLADFARRLDRCLDVLA